MRVIRYNISKNCRNIHTDKGAIDIALEGIKKQFLSCCDYDANDDAQFFITLEVERPVISKEDDK